MTIEQTVEIPANRRIYFDIPPQIPSGKAKVALTIVPEPPADRRSVGKDVLGMCLNRSTFENPPPKPLKPLRGIAKGSSFTVEQLRKDRDEDTHN